MKKRSSNESFYRVALARERWLRENPSATGFSTGHFHVAKIQDGNDLDDIYKGDIFQLHPISSNPQKYFYDKLKFQSQKIPPRKVKDELLKLIKTVEERIIMVSENN